jgi:nanoRNase/pAp phosphatase (c-di-AMP/oligoRNAs hydrolase)
LSDLIQVVDSIDQLLIMPHHNPDPDAMASAAALCFLLNYATKTKCRIGYSGIIGRAENKAFVKYLDMPLIRLDAIASFPPLALVDTQPGAGNILLPGGTDILIVVDHHTRQTDLSNVPFVAINDEAGATATILVEYFRENDIDIPRKLATALFYGIKSNTMGLGRNTSAADATAYYYLQPKIEVETLAKIEQARVPPQYFKSFDAALRNARIYNGLVISDLGKMDYPDMTAEIADLLLRLERARWVICMGEYEQKLVFSVRSRHRSDNAERLALNLVGGLGVAGGHRTIAGGQIALLDHPASAYSTQLVQRALKAVNAPPDSVGASLF